MAKQTQHGFTTFHEENDWRLPVAVEVAKQAKQMGISPGVKEFPHLISKLFYALAAKPEKIPDSVRPNYERALKEYSKSPKAFFWFAALVRANWPSEIGDVQQFANPIEQVLTEEQPKVTSKWKNKEPYYHVISVATAAEYAPDGVARSLEDFLKAKLPQADVSIKEFRAIDGKHIDLGISHFGYATEIVSALPEVNWVTDALIKPVSEFGIRIPMVKSAA